MVTVDVAPRAAADVDTILVYLHSRNGLCSSRAAAGRVQGIGPTSRAVPGLRSILAHPYVLIYRYDRARDTVFVLRVLHGRRRLALDVP